MLLLDLPVLVNMSFYKRTVVVSGLSSMVKAYDLEDFFSDVGTYDHSVFITDEESLLPTGSNCAP